MSNIWWIRRDLRLADNPALKAASDAGHQIIPVWIFDPHLLASPFVGQKRLAFLISSLRALDQSLRACGSYLVVRTGSPATVLRQLLQETGAHGIYAARDYSPYARTRDETVKASLPLHLTKGTPVRAPGDVLKEDGTPYTVFTPYKRKWQALPPPTDADLIPAPRRITTPVDLDTEALPEKPILDSQVPFVPGEQAAQQQLKAFAEKAIMNYADQRDRLDLDGTSQLSPYLRFGMLSPRTAFSTAGRVYAQATDSTEREAVQAWLNELIWRDFYIQILHYFPHVRGSSFREKYNALTWENDPELFAAWCNGQTGYPVIDAAMRQMNALGWMHNRARMLVASFLVKDLLIDWRWGERYFMQQLLDGDPAANNGGWQWSAGTGTDAAPYFRIFSPVSQGKQHDPNGEYVRRWVPELRAVPDKYVHEPWKMAREGQRKAGCVLGEDYPHRIVKHAEARERVLEMYKAIV